MRFVLAITKFAQYKVELECAGKLKFKCVCECVLVYM